MISWKSAFGICFKLGFWERPSAAVPAEMHPGTSISHYFCDAAAPTSRRRRADIAPTFSRRGVLPRRSAGLPRAESASAPAGIRPGSSISHHFCDAAAPTSRRRPLDVLRPPHWPEPAQDQAFHTLLRSSCSLLRSSGGLPRRSGGLPHCGCCLPRRSGGLPHCGCCLPRSRGGLPHCGCCLPRSRGGLPPRRPVSRRM